MAVKETVFFLIIILFPLALGATSPVKPKGKLQIIFKQRETFIVLNPIDTGVEQSARTGFAPL